MTAYAISIREISAPAIDTDNCEITPRGPAESLIRDLAMRALIG